MGTETNWRRLLAAILARAVIDAQSDDPAMAGPARRWLAEIGTELVEWLEIPPRRVAAWVVDLPALSWEQMVLPLQLVCCVYPPFYAAIQPNNRNGNAGVDAAE